ncbi:MAG: ATP-dependent RNA helicase HrpA [Mariniblastus sp.]|nr:ATP-dependent RNA helicase HrpA [Mariniblastus sp.]
MSRPTRPQIEQLERRLAGVMQRDHFSLHRSIAQFKKGNLTADQAAQQLVTIEQQLDLSCQERQLRIDRLPSIELDRELPIFERQEEITTALQNHPVIVISGETGSGKSTQLPLIALAAGYGTRGMIGHTQPRRIAARGVASRIAQQLKTDLGKQVGFKIRFDDKTETSTLIKLMTDGILLAETQSDRFLDHYDLLIIDEAHERSLNIDFLIGYLRRILPKRPDLRVIITSATIDTKRFADHFTFDPERPVPVIDVEGRTYPVEIRYQEPDGEEEEADLNDAAVAAVQELARIDSGDMLLFLPTENDIRTVSRKLKGATIPGRASEVLPLYARLSTEQQNLIFQSSKRRRIVLATNVAESSITVPGIRFVIDTGTARISRYSPRSKVQRLPIEAISQASANQRAGRCGRIGPGICLRLYDEQDFETRAPFTTPEIRRTNLAAVILQTLILKLGNIDEFPFIDPPHPDALRDGYKTLFEIGAIDHHRRLTTLGRRLGRLPVDPRIGRMLVAADDEHCLTEILIIAAALEIQDPRIRPADRKKAADEQHEKFAHPKSDFMAFLNVWDFTQKLRKELSNSKYKLACQQNFLSVAHLRQWHDVYRQLNSMCRSIGLVPRPRKDDYNAIHRSLLAGLLSGVAMLSDRHEYTGAGGVKFHLWPGSGLFEEKPKWIVASEILETSRRYGRTVAKISADWIEPLAGHLVKPTTVDPHWSKKRQTAMAYENVSLFGLPIVNRRLTGIAKTDPETARELFVEQGLAGQQVTTAFDFYRHNESQLEELAHLAAKTRQREWILDSHRLIDFYESRLPQEAVDCRALQQLIKKEPSLNQQLKVSPADLVPGQADQQTRDQFPDEVQVGTMNLPVNYQFQPGQTDDGATVRIPLEGLGQLDDLQAGWLIPGLFEERIVALIKSLPKRIRRNFVPAPATAQVVARNLQRGQGSFVAAVAGELTRIGGEPITVDLFDPAKSDPYLKVNVQVVDAEGAVVAEGRSLAELREQLGDQHASNVVQVDQSDWQQTGLSAWSWGDLPEQVTITRGTTELAAFPAIFDEGETVGLKLVDSPAAAKWESQQGLTRLFQLAHRKLVRSQVAWLPDLDQHAVLLTRLVSPRELRAQLSDLIVRIGLVENGPLPRSQAEFDKARENAAEQLSLASQDVARWLPRFSSAVQAAYLALEQLPQRFAHTRTEIKQQIKALAGPGYLQQTPWRWLQHFPRYFQAIEVRIEKLPTAPPDQERAAVEEIDHYWQQYEQMQAQHTTQALVDPELEQFRWMVEEYRVSRFAQQLGTSLTVSAKRLEKQWTRVRQL